MASSDSQIDKPRGRPKRAELPDVNINTGAQSINTESFFKKLSTLGLLHPSPPEGLGLGGWLSHGDKYIQNRMHIQCNFWNKQLNHFGLCTSPSKA